MKRISLLLLAVVVAMSLRGGEITATQASTAVQTWVDEGYAMGRLPDAVSSAETVTTASGARLHVVKLSGGGFAVTSADDRIDPIIAFVPSGTELVQSDDNPLWVLLCGDIAARERAAGVSSGETKGGRMALLSSESDEAVLRAQARWAALLGNGASTKKGMSVQSEVTPSDVRVDSFVASRWSQSTHNNYAMGHGDNCYNYYTPSNYVCGCVATAGGQIMRYWQWPTASVTAKTVSCKVNGVSANFTMKGGTYSWANMPLVPANGVTEAQRQAIGKLTYDVGVSVGMDWRSGGSSSSAFALADRFPAVFGYANAVAAIYMAGTYPYSLTELRKVVEPNCNLRVPMVMSISKGTSGHAVVVDGYGYSGSDYCIHVNLGWAGMGDAWYIPPDIEDFDTISGFVFNIFPQETGSIISGRVLDAGGAPIANATVTLKRGSTTVATKTTDAKGIYAFVAAPNSYVVTATYGAMSADLGVTLAKTTGTRITSTGAWYTSAASIGNTFDSDISITGVASVAPPSFSPESCLFYPSTNVTIACAESGAVIRYTVDGSDPSQTSTLYTGPIFVDDTVTIKARAFKDGKNPSAVVGSTYTYDAAAGAPKGDYFADPIKISGASGTHTIDDNSSYTVEAGEPWHTLQNGSYYYQYHTVWYKWTAPGSGVVTFATRMTHYLGGTYVAVYTGDALATVSRIGFSDEADSDYWTRVSVEVSQGTTYRIVGMSCGQQYTDEFAFSWSGDLTVQQTETTTTPVHVPYSWLDTYYPSASSDVDAREELAFSDSDGDGYSAWAEYAANSDPTNAASKLSCEISMGPTGVPVVTVKPSAAREGFPRVLQGKAELNAGTWTNLSAPSKDYRFYRAWINVGD